MWNFPENLLFTFSKDNKNKKDFLESPNFFYFSYISLQFFKKIQC